MAAAQHGEASLGGQTIRYQIVRSARRSVGLKIDQQGLTLQLPRRFALRDIDAVLQDKSNWILTKLAELQARPAAPSLAAATEIDWLGEAYPLQISASRSAVKAGVIYLAAADNAAIPTALSRLMQREARQFLAERLQHWAAQLKLQPNAMQLSGARTRWGSCSATGGIRLNWRLMQAPVPIIDYVVIHELCHLVEMNHSPRFWALVASACPDWKQKRAWLKQHGARYLGW